MGIKDFHKWMKSQYISAFKTKWLSSYDHVYIDLNFALHNCSYKAKNINDIYERLYIFIDGVLHMTLPRVSLVLGADGPAPLAKLLLQRKRRLTKSRGQETIDGVSSIIFTPGTQFMDTLESGLKPYTDFIKKIYNIDILFEINNDDEAELKLKRTMMKNIKLYPNNSHVIITNDADVIVMLMTLPDLTKIYVYEKGFQNSETISMGKLLLLHVEKVSCSFYPNLDFSAMSIFMGNDYLPKINFITLEKLWASYSDAIICDHRGLILNSDLQINIPFLCKILFGILKRTKQHFIKRILPSNLCHPMYKNYMDGYTWCLTTYNTAVCTRYNYMYGFQCSPHPLGLLINIKKNPKLIITSNEIFNSIDRKLYTILLIPNKYSDLINKDYKNFIKKVSILYDEENCTKCGDFYKKIKNLKCQLDKKNDEDNINIINKNIIQTQKILSLHKKSHTDLTLDDIITIINKYKKYKSLL